MQSDAITVGLKLQQLSLALKDTADSATDFAKLELSEAVEGKLTLLKTTQGTTVQLEECNLEKAEVQLMASGGNGIKCTVVGTELKQLVMQPNGTLSSEMTCRELTVYSLLESTEPLLRLHQAESR